MKTSGIFFLRGRPSSVRLLSPTEGTVPGWLFLLGERTSARGVSIFSAIWRGPEADRFIAAHPNLRAGDCLRLELDRLHASENELRGHVTRCEVAPPRWPEPSNTEGADGAVGAPSARAQHQVAAGHVH